MYASSIEGLQTSFEKAMSSEVCTRHHKVIGYFQAMYDRRENWAISNRQDLPVRGNMTKNFCEGTMRVLKDQILHRTKSFNVQKLLDFILSRMEAYYQRRCLYVANPGTLFMEQSNSTPYNVFQRKNLNENQPTNGSKIFGKYFLN